jgi:thymidylate synthase (FAD)
LNRESVIDFVKINCRNSSYILQKHIPHTVIFTCDRGVSHEFVRHRPASFAQESTRYCNYIKDKFGNEITVIEPCFFTDQERKTAYDAWLRSCEVAEKEYFNILEAGGTPQEARDVLPTSTKTEIAITATEKEWRHIINLRYHGVTGAPHPQMVEVMTIAYPFLVEASEGRVDHKYEPCVDAIVADPDEFTLRIKKLSDTAVLPTRGSDGAAGFDLYADSVEGEFSTYTAEDGSTHIICAGGTNVTVNTGIAMAIPKGYVGLIFARSGLACKAGLRPANCVGVIDEDYRGPIKVVLHNDIDFANCQLTFKIDDNNNVSVDDNPFINNFSEFALHDRVAQIVFVKYEAFRLMEVESLDETDRGEGGFGSTGLK